MIMRRLINGLLFLFLCSFSVDSQSQNLTQTDLTRNKWISEPHINDFNMCGFKEIRLTKLNVEGDSSKRDSNIWIFKEGKLEIWQYLKEKGWFENDLRISYQYKDCKLIIYHPFQDSSVWQYLIENISESSIVLTRID